MQDVSQLSVLGSASTPTPHLPLGPPRHQATPLATPLPCHPAPATTSSSPHPLLIPLSHTPEAAVESLRQMSSSVALHTAMQPERK